MRIPLAGMKRQVAVTGHTPEFVRWSVRFACPIRRDTDIASIDQSEKRLRAIRAAGAAVSANQVSDGIAVKRDGDGAWWGFRLDDVCEVWGGFDTIRDLCSACPANVAVCANVGQAACDGLKIEASGDVAGCSGWLADDGRTELWHRLSEESWPEWDRIGILPTWPKWYGLWSSGALDGEGLELAKELFLRISRRESAIAEPARQFHSVLTRAAKSNLIVDVELVPCGWSDGVAWTIFPFCDRCRAPRKTIGTACPVCKKRGGRHERVRRRVLGKRPWVPLNSMSFVMNSDPEAARH